MPLLILLSFAFPLFVVDIADNFYIAMKVVYNNSV